MKLDVILPTYNRASLLRRTLDSLIAARRPPDLDVTVVVVDNNSTDITAELVSLYKNRLPQLEYVFETQQGLSAALNAGIRTSTSELIATINDDEEVDSGWFEVIYNFFHSCNFDFAGGPYKPNWVGRKPDWLPREFGAVVGWVDAGDKPREYGPAFNAMLMGGNAVFRRHIFEKVGLYNTALGRSATGLASCEDEDMFDRIMAANFRGMYLPDLIIHHYIPPERMTRAYHRRWCWGRGTSNGLRARGRYSAVPEVIGIPRWQIRRAVAGTLTALKSALRLAPACAGFAAELYIWDLAGYIYGKFFRRIPRNSLEPLAGGSLPEHAG